VDVCKPLADGPVPSLALDDQAVEWPIVWLVRKGGGGFSGGWRGCAIDLKLAVGPGGSCLPRHRLAD
jgi:hypothetical protein